MFLKYFRVLAAFIRALLILWFVFPKLNRQQKLDEFQKWSRHVLEVLNVQVRLIHPATTTGCRQGAQLVVANHISWLDVIVIQSFQPCIFVAKQEVRQWPVIGRLSEACGVVFVDRSSSGSARKMVHAVTDALKEGCCVAGFPEGTSSDGREVGHFHASLFEAAVLFPVDVRPCALRYIDPTTDKLCVKAAYFGETSFASSLRQVISARSITAKVHVGTPLTPQGHSRRSLAQLSQRIIGANLNSTQVCALNG